MDGEDPVEIFNGRKKRRVGEKEVKLTEDGGSSTTSSSELRIAIEKLYSERSSTTVILVPTSSFLSISNLLLLLLDKIGPTMAVLRSDIQTNVQRLEERYVMNPSLYSNLVEILKREREEGVAKRRNSCSRAVVWLNRSVEFGLDVMERLMKDKGLSVEEAVEEAYCSKLKPWHGWISSAAYKVALRMIPNRIELTELVMGNQRDYSMMEDEIRVLGSIVQPILDEINSQLRILKLAKLRSK
ncbi:hypothetical protein ZOSMA_161G00460 [Zostera marina]|uniref:Glycolipid transfer protein domain-containing protein n=1 Tax=Zostera marina TaxID=29655 RepID=A0A0K9PWH8_ZOSMR|nr:hypothetical protein ZOSMA_161G00460 [Zostera marina]